MLRVLNNNTKMAKIIIGSDHAGFALKEQIKKWLQQHGWTVIDMSNTRLQPEDDYPTIALRVARAVAKQSGARGVLLCGNAQGVCIVANKVQGIRAAVGYSLYGAQTSRQDDDSNVLCLAGRVLTVAQAQEMLHIWLETNFSQATRHVRRLQEISSLEKNQNITREIIPSLLVKNISQFKKRLTQIERYFPLAQLDVADNTLVSNETFADWKQIRRIKTDVVYDLHLMIQKPDDYLHRITSFNKIYRVFFHIESDVDAPKLIRWIRRQKTQAGIALHPSTSIKKVRSLLPQVDAVLLLGVKPGFNGARFQPTTIKRIKELRALYRQATIVVDGGIRPETIGKVFNAGADAVVVGSYLHQAKDWSKAIAKLRAVKK